MYQIISDIDMSNNLLKNPIKTCIGCYSCWIKTPGKCIFDDPFNPAIIESKKIIIISKITFGSYSSKVKSLIDRTIPLNLPTFKKINGQLHHEKRYSEYPELHVIGYGSQTQRDENTFKRLVKAHSVNFHAPKYSVTICDQASVETALKELIGES